MLVLDIYPKELKVGTYTDTCMYNSIHCGIIYHRWKLEIQVYTNGWICEHMWSIDTMGCEPSKDILIHKTTWVKLENGMPSERGLTQKMHIVLWAHGKLSTTGQFLAWKWLTTEEKGNEQLFHSEFKTFLRWCNILETVMMVVHSTANIIYAAVMLF